MLVARRRVEPGWLLLALAIGVVSTAEILVELVEYPLLYAGHLRVTAYLDTLVDLVTTVVGGVVGSTAGLAFARTRARRR